MVACESDLYPQFGLRMRVVQLSVIIHQQSRLCHKWVTQTGARALPATANPPPSSARAGDRPYHPARTVPIAGDSDWSPRPANDGDPAALIGPGRGLAIQPRPDGANSR